MIPLTLLDVLLIVLFIIFASRVLRRHIHRRIPPGPPGSWLVGNTYQIPTDKQWLKFDEWINKYGELSHYVAHPYTSMIRWSGAQYSRLKRTLWAGASYLLDVQMFIFDFVINDLFDGGRDGPCR